MMSNEEFDRRIEFFLNQQAQFDADIQELKEADKRINEKLEGFFQSLVELRDLTHEGFKQNMRRFDAVARSFKVIAQNGRETDARIKVLVDSQIRTEELVKNIGAKLDRHLDDDHNGSPKPNNP